MITVHLPPDLAHEFGAERILTVEAHDCAELLHSLNLRYPSMASWLATEDGRFRQHLSVFISGQRLTAREVLSTSIPDRSEVWILRAISGG